MGEIDNRGSHFYLAMFWANKLAEQKEDQELSKVFSDLFEEMKNNEEAIFAEINQNQGKKHDIQGYYMPDINLTSSFMRPSKIFNDIIDSF